MRPASDRYVLLAITLFATALVTACTLVHVPPEPVVIETGVASWYGPKFHGRKTANGERYDMHAMTAAHPSLPFGTVLEVRNLDNGKVCRVRINDRGPFVGGRVVDLSYAAARRIDMVRPGIARVELAVIDPVRVAEGDARRVPSPAIVPASNVAPAEGSLAAAIEGDFTVQVGAFSERERAATLQRMLATHYPTATVRSDGAWHRVHVGRFSERAPAEALRSELEELGWVALVVVVR